MTLKTFLVKYKILLQFLILDSKNVRQPTVDKFKYCCMP